MSKYTTEVRFICETNAGLSSSVGCDNVDSVLNKSWNKIFTTNIEFFDTKYKSILCKKILKHYYLREICCETVGIWKLWLNERLEMIMPYYNQLYESAKLEFNPLYNTEIIRVENRQDSGSKESTSSVDSSGTNTDEKKDLYSDTPQGSLSGVQNETYLTNARKINVSNKSTDSSDYSGNEKTNNEADINESIKGKQGGESYSKLLLEFRQTFLNIDNMVIEEFEDLFMGLW